jgi:hypothetical protein
MFINKHESSDDRSSIPRYMNMMDLDYNFTAEITYTIYCHTPLVKAKEHRCVVSDLYLFLYNPEEKQLLNAFCKRMLYFLASLPTLSPSSHSPSQLAESGSSLADHMTPL